MTIFLKKSLNERIQLDCKGVDFFLDLMNLEEKSEENVRIIMEEARKLPAALGGYHGGYRGGLFDHILLVTNLSYNIYHNPLLGAQKLEELNVPHLDDYSIIKLEDVVKAAIYHDFGKVPYYLYRKGFRNRKVITYKTEREAIHREIESNFGYKGNDAHVEECIAVLKKFNIPYNDDIYQAIIFHHGRWSKYRPINSNSLGILLHSADMIASRQYKI
mgnify:CR=1 FL=1